MAIAIDVDYNICSHNTNKFLINYNIDWKQQLLLFNKDIDSIKGPFDTLICSNSIHNVDGAVFGNYINQLSHTGSEFFIRFLDNTQLQKILAVGNNSFIADKENFVRYYGSDMNRIKYYYSHCHRHPIIEKVITKEDILDIVGKDKWVIKKYICRVDADGLDRTWQNYLQCFSILVLRRI